MGFRLLAFRTQMSTRVLGVEIVRAFIACTFALTFSLIRSYHSDLNVRRAALVTFNTAAHNKPMLIRDLLTDMLPLLYRETLIRKELIREVEMGPFKHMEDDGLDLRKVAFECMYTLLDTCLDRIDIFDFLSHVEHGLKDHSDILMLTHLMLVRLCTLVPNAVYQSKRPPSFCLLCFFIEAAARQVIEVKQGKMRQ